MRRKSVSLFTRDKWHQATVADLMTPCSAENSVNALDDAVKVLSLMNRTTNSRLLVVDRDRPVGVVTLKDLLDFLALKLNPEGEGARVKHLPLGLG